VWWPSLLLLVWQVGLDGTPTLIRVQAQPMVHEAATCAADERTGRGTVSDLPIVSKLYGRFFFLPIWMCWLSVVSFDLNL
jgi:hypothetical protein